MTALITRADIALAADPKRVLARLFVPGQELLHDTQSRATGVLARTLALDEDEAAETLRRVLVSYAGRHRDLDGILLENFDRIEHRIPDGVVLTDDRRRLIGSAFTNEYSIEGAALFNPSAVPHPDQSGLAAGECRFILSLRACGEGHISSVEFRTGVVGPGQSLRIDDPGPHVETGETRSAPYGRRLFAAKLTEEGADSESSSYLLRCLPPQFDEVDLEKALAALAAQRVTRQGGPATDEMARRIARSSYAVVFSPATSLSERVLWPHAPAESHGIEDARFVRFVEDDGTVDYRATYTAFDGDEIAPQLIETVDFRSFRMSQLAGPAAKNKGMALFPRRISGEYFALSRWDRENSAIATSADGRWWGDARTLQMPVRPWELIQLGNCGSPVETEAGWVVLTHGVGPMREYAIGALLLDRDDPHRVIASLREPLLTPTADERDGYVPNVVYSCGPLLFGDSLLIPYGASDASVRFAFVDMPTLLDRLLADGPPALMRSKSAT